MNPSQIEIDKESKIALEEVKEIAPWFDTETNSWLFEHPAYDLQAEGVTSEDCIETYKRWLRELIKLRLKGRLASNVEARTTGYGGFRSGAGRPKGTKKELKLRIYLPVDIVNWLRSDPGHIEELRRLMGS